MTFLTADHETTFGGCGRVFAGRETPCLDGRVDGYRQLWITDGALNQALALALAESRRWSPASPSRFSRRVILRAVGAEHIPRQQQRVHHRGEGHIQCDQGFRSPVGIAVPSICALARVPG
jgi:hypothetical protein